MYNIVFFGSSKYSRIVEEEVHKKYPISLVVTIPERKSGSQVLVSPVKTFADSNNIPVITADKLTDEIIGQIGSLSSQGVSNTTRDPHGLPAMQNQALQAGISHSVLNNNERPDFLIVADYGLLLPKKLLDLPSKAPLNVHHSLLPKFRGPSPAPSAILSGEHTTGVTVMEMGEGLDTGDILAQKKYDLLSTDTTDSLLTNLNQLGAELLLTVLADFETYYANRKKQDESQASFTKQMNKQDGYIELNPKSEIRNPKQTQNIKSQNVSYLDIRALDFPIKLNRAVRAYFPWPGVWFTYRIKNQEVRIKLLPSFHHAGALAIESRSYRGLQPLQDDILLQVEGKKPMTIKDFLNGYPKEGKEILEKLKLI